MIDFFQNNVDIVFAFFLIVTGQISDHFRISFDHGQRCLDVMGNIGDQISSQFIHLFKLTAGMIQGIGQFCDLFKLRGLEMDIVIAFGQAHGAFLHLNDRTG